MAESDRRESDRPESAPEMSDVSEAAGEAEESDSEE